MWNPPLLPWFGNVFCPNSLDSINFQVKFRHNLANTIGNRLTYYLLTSWMYLLNKFAFNHSCFKWDRNVKSATPLIYWSVSFLWYKLALYENFWDHVDLYWKIITWELFEICDTNTYTSEGCLTLLPTLSDF